MTLIFECVIIYMHMREKALIYKENVQKMIFENWAKYVNYFE